MEKPAARTPVQARSRATVDAILQGTAKVLAERGYAKATTNHIAEAAGVSIGSFYQYFADKDAAVAAYVDHYSAETLAFAWAHIADGHEQRSPVAAWLHALLERTCEDEALVRVLFWEVPFTWSLPSVRAALAGAVEVVESLAGEALGEDEAARHDRAYVILKSAVAVVTDVAADPELRSRRVSIVDELARMIDAYLVAR
jgi:AcrR family transcriptional regulator